ncbi:MAG TPA: DUF4149 domain-containing protein [Vicinamibacterales bacterium]|jgi:hypothetical protein
MLALRYVALLALVTWVGGLLALGGIAAPVVFDVTAARHVADGRLLAGALFGEMLRRFQPVSWTAGGVLLLTLIARAVLGPRPRRLAWRAAVATVMLAASLYAGLVVTTRMEQLEAGIGVAPSSLAPDDARRIDFGRLHGLASGLQLVPLLGGLLLMFWEMKE